MTTPEDLRFLSNCLNTTKFSILGGAVQLQQSTVFIIQQENRKYFFKRCSVHSLIGENYVSNGIQQRLLTKQAREKWQITLHSFRNEQYFLKNYASVFRIPGLIGLEEETRNEHDEFLNVFRTLQEYLEFDTFNSFQEKSLVLTTIKSNEETLQKRQQRMVEKNLLTVEDSMCVIDWISKLHDYFYVSNVEENNPNNNKQHKFGWLRFGGWWRKCNRPSIDFSAAAHVDVTFKNVLEFLKFNKTDFDWMVEAMKGILREKNNDEFIKALEKQSLSACTIIHGDVKSSNIMLLLRSNNTLNEEETNSVVLLDFQWVGHSPGVGLADLIYLIFGSVKLDSQSCYLEESEKYDDTMLMMRANENKIKWQYYNAMGGERKQNTSLQTFEASYNLELLDYFSTAMPYLFPSLINESTFEANRFKHGFLTFEFFPLHLKFFIIRSLEAWNQF